MTDAATGNREDKVEVTLRIDRKLHEAMQPFFDQQINFANLDELVQMLLRALTRTPDSGWGQSSFMDFLFDVAEQRNVGFEYNLFGRRGNELDRRQLYAMLLGYNRYDIATELEQDEYDDKGPEKFAQDVARRLARDLDRRNAEAIIATMTLGNEGLHQLMMHWLDVYLTEERKG
ncbi:MAG: hypothetical protein C0519_06800 [Hyphomicrobium sp.]|nr:hypothetical protein [Hyphomicrobium sp.]